MHLQPNGPKAPHEGPDEGSVALAKAAEQAGGPGPEPDAEAEPWAEPEPWDDPEAEHVPERQGRVAQSDSDPKLQAAVSQSLPELQQMVQQRPQAQGRASQRLLLPCLAFVVPLPSL